MTKEKIIWVLGAKGTLIRKLLYSQSKLILIFYIYNIFKLKNIHAKQQVDRKTIDIAGFRRRSTDIIDFFYKKIDH